MNSPSWVVPSGLERRILSDPRNLAVARAGGSAFILALTSDPT